MSELAPPLVPDPDDVVDLGAGRGPRWLDDMLRDGSGPELVGSAAAGARPPGAGSPGIGHQRADPAHAAMRSGIKANLMPTGTGVIAEVGSGERVVGLRADIDALPISRGAPACRIRSTLPQVSHACGHDVHLTVLLGAARALARAGDLGGRVRLIFQPAEEVFPGGSHDVIAAGGIDGLTETVRAAL